MKPQLWGLGFGLSCLFSMVAPSLAALASAPPGKMLIRLVWKDGFIRDVEIGPDTVQAWKTIYR